MAAIPNPCPSTVPGYISHAEGVWLRMKAHGKLCLEVGAFRGRSTVYIGQSASRLLSCDSFMGQKSILDGQKIVDMRAVERDWWANVRLFGLTNAVTLFRMDSVACYRVLKRLEYSSFGLIFIDGGHDREAVAHDTGFASLVEPSGVIAFHDYHSVKFPAVREAVDCWSRMNPAFHRLQSVGSIAAFRREKRRFEREEDD